jgi:hypothetical protein
VALSSNSIRPLMPTPAAKVPWLESSAPSAASRMYAVPFAYV